MKKLKDYINSRLSSGRDDRTCTNKWFKDAELRGSIGVNKANKIIKAIDKIKSER